MSNWTIYKLEKCLQKDLQACNNEFERSNAKAICGIEIRKLAEKLASEGKLTANDATIASKYGYRN